MIELPYVNLGCGNHFHPAWVNIDFVGQPGKVIQHNLLKGIPLADESMEVVYHSHVLEHFPRERAEIFIRECWRVLKPGGILRVAIPDLERIARTYLECVARLDAQPHDEVAQANHQWMLLEMYDQTVRNTSGGDMSRYLTSGSLMNRDFVLDRCGEEVKNIIDAPVRHRNTLSTGPTLVQKMVAVAKKPGLVMTRLKRMLLGSDYALLEMARFRTQGEIHQWMYDRHNLARLLAGAGFFEVRACTAFESRVPGWANFNLDGRDGRVRKPDSLFMEAQKRP